MRITKSAYCLKIYSNPGKFIGGGVVPCGVNNYLLIARRTTMAFEKEIGALVDKDKNVLHVITGSVATVDMAGEILWKMHQKDPGSVWGFLHIHPPEMTELSSTDMESFRAWCMALHPWPLRFGVISEIRGEIAVNETYHPIVTDYLVEHIYYGQLESKASWISRGKKGERKFKYLLEGSSEYMFNSSSNPSHINIFSKLAYGSE